MKKKLTILIMALSLVLAACSTDKVVELSPSDKETTKTETTSTEKKDSTTEKSETAKEESSKSTETTTEKTNSTETNSANATQINLSEGSKTITKSGTYEITGTLAEGSLTVNVDKNVDDKDVILIFNNVNITSAKEAPVNIIEGKNVYIVLADGSVNTITQGNISTTDSEFPSAAIYSKADLFIKGEGSLKVTTAYNDGITSKDSLVIETGNIEVTSAQDGIVGKDDLTINGGTIQVAAGKDGLKATNEEAGKGVVVINGGNINITESDEGIEAYGITINNGTIKVKSSDDGLNIKTTGVLEINGGDLYVEASGDGLDSNGSIVINDGKVVVNTTTIGPSDTPLDADYGITINGGTVVDQNGNALSTEQVGPGGPGMGGAPGMGNPGGQRR